MNSNDDSVDRQSQPNDRDGDGALLEAGTHIGPYTVFSHLGAGAAADLYNVFHSKLHTHRAMKVPARRLWSETSAMRRFVQEARLGADLHHPNIVAVHDISGWFREEGDNTPPAIGDIPYFTMELIDGTDIRRLLENRKRLPLPETIAILRGVARALDFAHSRGVIHRDLKPSNVLLKNAPDQPYGYVPMVADFGIAHAGIGTTEGVDLTRLTYAGYFMGTMLYASPEQTRGAADVTAASDQYSLGVMAYEMLSGAPPFPSGDPVDIMSKHRHETPRPLTGAVGEGVPSARLNAVLLRALAKKPEERFPNCVTFVDALAGMTAAANSPVAAAAPQKPRPMMAPLFAGIAALAACVALVYAITRPHTAAPAAEEPPDAAAAPSPQHRRSVQPASAQPEVRRPPSAKHVPAQPPERTRSTPITLGNAVVSRPAMPTPVRAETPEARLPVVPRPSPRLPAREEEPKPTPRPTERAPAPTPPTEPHAAALPAPTTTPSAQDEDDAGIHVSYGSAAVHGAVHWTVDGVSATPDEGGTLQHIRPGDHVIGIEVVDPTYGTEIRKRFPVSVTPGSVAVVHVGARLPQIPGGDRFNSIVTSITVNGQALDDSQVQD